MDREFKCLPVFYRAASRTGETSTYEQALVMTAVTIDEFLDFVLSRQLICECCGKSLDMRVGSTDFAIDHFHDNPKAGKSYDNIFHGALTP